ncbi:hypothetical protein G6F52_013680 [Rhizopus delemar]|nr:hypothetical protein G6F52_013680 [Rhizopus delemar]
MNAMERSFNDALAAHLQLSGEFDDQDRVLAGQAHRGQHRHLEVDVAFQALEGVGQYRAEDAQRGGQQHGGRHAPAFIHRGQAQEHEQQRDGAMSDHAWLKPSGKVSARRAISAIASPELTPGAGWPGISIADKPL